ERDLHEDPHGRRVHYGDPHQQAADRDRAGNRIREPVAFHPPLPRRLRRYALTDSPRRPPSGQLTGNSLPWRGTKPRAIRSPLTSDKETMMAATDAQSQISALRAEITQLQKDLGERGAEAYETMRDRAGNAMEAA